MKPFYIVLGLVLLAGIGVLVTQLMPRKGAGSNQPMTVVLTPNQLQGVKGIARGRADAPITIYEFADYQCPHCAEFAWKLEPLIRDSLVNTGKAQYIFYEMPLGFKWSFLSARSGRCANEQGKFWEYHDLLFARQQDWAFDEDPAAKFTDYAKTAGLDAGKFEQCVRSEKYQREVSESGQLANSLGVQGTPTLFVNVRKITTPSTYHDFALQVRSIVPAAFGDAPAAAPAATAPAAGAPADPAAPPAGT
jgi:protein-disulfide isomerase